MHLPFLYHEAGQVWPEGQRLLDRRSRTIVEAVRGAHLLATCEKAWMKGLHWIHSSHLQRCMTTPRTGGTAGRAVIEGGLLRIRSNPATHLLDLLQIRENPSSTISRWRVLPRHREESRAATGGDRWIETRYPRADLLTL